MASRYGDLCVWTGLGVFGLVAFKTFLATHRDLLYLVETHEEPKRLGVWEVTQETEDAINPEALKVLATSSNYDIRKAAIQILSDRFLHTPSALASLKQDLRSLDPARRSTAVRAVKLIDRHTSKKNFIEYLLPYMSWSRADGGEGANLGRNSGARVQQRTRQETPEEQEQRRRRREAIVLNEGDRPLSHEDIIQRGGRNWPNNAEETRRLEQSIAELARENPERHARFMERFGSVDGIADGMGRILEGLDVEMSGLWESQAHETAGRQENRI